MKVCAGLLSGATEVGQVSEPSLRFKRGAAAAVAVWLTAGAAGAQSAAGLGMAVEPFHASERHMVEEEWARQLVAQLGLEDGLPANPKPSDYYGLLCVEKASAPDADAEPGEGLRIAHPVAPTEPGEPVRVVLDAPASAVYRLDVEGVGLQRWSVDQRLIGHIDATRLGVAAAPKLMALRAGPHEFTGILVRGARADRVELSAQRPLCIAPADGWKTGRVLTHGVRARTLVRALGLESYLPERSTIAAVEGERYDSASRWTGRTQEGGATGKREEYAAAGASPAEFSYRVRLPEPGLMSLEARISGEGAQLWSLDGRMRASVEPGVLGFGWQHVLTGPLASGEHVVRALVPAGSSIDRIRIVTRAAEDPDYVEVLEQMGFTQGHVHARVPRGQAMAIFRDPAMEMLFESFLTRVAGGDEPPVPAVNRQLAPLYPRPLSPVLASDL
jgi:hypothetical protein